MGRLIAVLALAGAAAFAVHPGSASRSHAAVAPAVTATPADAAIDAAERDFAGRQAEVGLVGGPAGAAARPREGAQGAPPRARGGGGGHRAPAPRRRHHEPAARVPPRRQRDRLPVHALRGVAGLVAADGGRRAAAADVLP